MKRHFRGGKLNREVGDKIREARRGRKTICNLSKHMDQDLLISFQQNSTGADNNTLNRNTKWNRKEERGQGEDERGKRGKLSNSFSPP